MKKKTGKNLVNLTKLIMIAISIIFSLSAKIFSPLIKIGSAAPNEILRQFYPSNIKDNGDIDFTGKPVLLKNTFDFNIPVYKEYGGSVTEQGFLSPGGELYVNYFSLDTQRVWFADSPGFYIPGKFFADILGTTGKGPIHEIWIDGGTNIYGQPDFLHIEGNWPHKDPKVKINTTDLSEFVSFRSEHSFKAEVLGYGDGVIIIRGLNNKELRYVKEGDVKTLDSNGKPTMSTLAPVLEPAHASKKVQPHKSNPNAPKPMEEADLYDKEALDAYMDRVRGNVSPHELSDQLLTKYLNLLPALIRKVGQDTPKGRALLFRFKKAETEVNRRHILTPLSSLAAASAACPPRSVHFRSPPSFAAPPPQVPASEEDVTRLTVEKLNERKKALYEAIRTGSIPDIESLSEIGLRNLDYLLKALLAETRENSDVNDMIKSISVAVGEETDKRSNARDLPDASAPSVLYFNYKDETIELNLGDLPDLATATARNIIEKLKVRLRLEEGTIIELLFEESVIDEDFDLMDLVGEDIGTKQSPIYVKISKQSYNFVIAYEKPMHFRLTLKEDAKVSDVKKIIANEYLQNEKESGRVELLIFGKLLRNEFLFDKLRIRADDEIVVYIGRGQNSEKILLSSMYKPPRL
ncbi:MAG: hypothetical protein LBF33_01920 [Oscillospiraceae bacterium]|nr:hypothetical protein [Oscillospiraceae bacterium]